MSIENIKVGRSIFYATENSKKKDIPQKFQFRKITKTQNIALHVLQFFQLIEEGFYRLAKILFPCIREKVDIVEITETKLRVAKRDADKALQPSNTDAKVDHRKTLNGNTYDIDVKQSNANSNPRFQKKGIIQTAKTDIAVAQNITNSTSLNEHTLDSINHLTNKNKLTFYFYSPRAKYLDESQKNTKKNGNPIKTSESNTTLLSLSTPNIHIGFPISTNSTIDTKTQGKPISPKTHHSSRIPIPRPEKTVLKAKTAQDNDITQNKKIKQHSNHPSYLPRPIPIPIPHKAATLSNKKINCKPTKKEAASTPSQSKKRQSTPQRGEQYAILSQYRRQFAEKQMKNHIAFGTRVSNNTYSINTSKLRSYGQYVPLNECEHQIRMAGRAYRIEKEKNLNSILEEVTKEVTKKQKKPIQRMDRLKTVF